jgi:hypothetical protein
VTRAAFSFLVKWCVKQCAGTAQANVYSAAPTSSSRVVVSPDGAGDDEGSDTSTEVLLLAVGGPLWSDVRVSIKAATTWSAVREPEEVPLVVVGYRKMSITMQNEGGGGTGTHHDGVLTISINAAFDYS